MKQDEKTPTGNKKYQPLKISEKDQSIPLANGDPLPYKVYAGWEQLFDVHDVPNGNLFFTAYFARGKKNRPLTFCFNGGPGAASAYLHFGVLGPRIAKFNADGSMPKPPAEINPNPHTWLQFTDLVFIDPMGTGFSRLIKADKNPPGTGQEDRPTLAKEDGIENQKENPFWNVKADLESLGQFIQRHLSRYDRWLSPIFIAGESYGGFRAARLTRMLQDQFGIGVNGAILISPAIEYTFGHNTDYSTSYWVDVFPSIAAIAYHHKKIPGNEPLETFLAKIEQFTRQKLLPLICFGDDLEEAEQEQTFQQISNLTGLPLDLVKRKKGRISYEDVAKALLKDEKSLVGIYDGSLKAIDPFYDRNQFDFYSDKSLFAASRVLTSVTNTYFRQELGIKTPLTYHLLNLKVYENFKDEQNSKLNLGRLHAMDELRTGMALNEDTKVLIVHGYYDLITPYFASKRLIYLMKLDDRLKENIRTRNYCGGHMFYFLEKSKQQFFCDAQAFFETCR